MKIKIAIEIEDNEGEIVDRIVRAIETLASPPELPAPKREQFMSDPANFPESMRPVPRRRNGHA